MAHDLRQRAEDLLDTNPVATPAVPTADVQKLVHELQVHQVELEMQNEELRRGQLELAETRDAYVELYDFAPVGYLTLDAEGCVLEANHTAAILLGVERAKLIRRTFADFVGRDSQDEWFRYARAIPGSDEKQKATLTLRRDGETPFTARLVARPMPSDVTDGWRWMVALIDISDLTKAEDALREAHDNLERLVAERTTQLRRLTAELFLAEEQERRRIAGELHDELGQMLATCRIRLDLLRDTPLPAAATQHVDSLTAILDRAIEATRTLTFELSCPLLDELGLESALEQLCQDMSREPGVQFVCRVDRGCIPMSDERRLILYRCTRELLVNVVRHAEARDATVAIETMGDLMRILVEDNGVGFDASDAGRGFSPSGGFGLFNTSEYIRHAGGRLRIESVSGEGTRVTLEVPLETP